MNGTVQKAVRKASRVEHAALRTPLAVLDERVLAHVPGGSKLRGIVGRGIQALDSAAGRTARSGSRAGSADPSSGTPAEIPAEEVEQRASHLLEEQQQHPLAGELAEDDELRRVQAQLKAKHAVEAEQEAGNG